MPARFASAQVRINLVNANLIAERRGMNLIEIKKQQHDESYETILSLSTKSGAQNWTVRGTVLQGEAHIVAINDLWVDMVAAGNFILTGHQDRPGIIGRVGTKLGRGFSVNASVALQFENPRVTQ